jgi:acyl carrier protein
VIHAATVLNDHFISESNPTNFATALDPKIHGAWNLHTATLHRKLDFFVGFSSVTAIVGSPRQANYCAGNAFLDELARYREAIGLPGLSINWGALSGAGLVERNAKTRAYLETIGVETFTVQEALLVLEKLLTRQSPQIAAARIEWSSLIRLAPKIGSLALYAPIVESLPKGRRSGSIRAVLLAAPPDQRQRLLEDFVTEHVATVFGAEGESFDRSVPVNQLGLDSIMAIELLNRIEGELGIHFPMGSVLNGPSIEQLSRTLLQSVQTSGDEGDDPTSTQTPDG